MGSVNDVRRRAGLRATPLMIAAAVLAACSSGSAESGPEPGTYRLLGRSPEQRWARVGQPRLPVEARAATWTPSHLTDRCGTPSWRSTPAGWGPICTPANIGHRCAVAAVPAHGRD